MTIVNYVSILR